jgi:serine/threonine protein kinase
MPTCGEDGAKLDSPRTLPYLLLGRYRFLRVLGQGGMGVVFSAHDERLDRDVAVKLIRPEHFTNATLKQRFEREARAVARIQHPGVIEIHDSGELDDGTTFLVMERLAGRDLRFLLKEHGRGTPAQAARLVRQGCAALGAAHRAGIIHRDVKPENVFLVDDPSGFRVKLLDFGIAKSLAFESSLTQRGMVLGTPTYMAPEHVRGEEVDRRADVYSFAAVAYEALTGTRAVPGDDLARVFIQVLNTVPPPVSSVLPGIPPEVDAAFAAALAKDSANRPKDIELWGSSFADLLEAVPADAAMVGWPFARNVFTEARSSWLDNEPTAKVSRARRS